MLIRKEHINEDGLLGLWKMEESKEELLQLFPENLRAKASAYVSKIRSERRALEWLTTRLMVLILLGEEKITKRRKTGQPYITDGSYHISISHTKDYAAILLHKTHLVGIDIEARSERVLKIAEKFISENEFIDLSQQVEHQLLHWSAKESLFKVMNLKGIDFKEHLHIEHFTPSASGMFGAYETKTDAKNHFTIHYEIHPDYVLTWLISPKK